MDLNPTDLRHVLRESKALVDEMTHELVRRMRSRGILEDRHFLSIAITTAIFFFAHEIGVLAATQGRYESLEEFPEEMMDSFLERVRSAVDLIMETSGVADYSQLNHHKRGFREAYEQALREEMGG